MSQMAFYFDGTRCTGCKTCEMSCKDFNDLGVGLTFRKVFEATLGETTRDADGAITTTCVSYPVSMSCNHCDSPVCMAKCPQAAISKNSETGFVEVDREKCIGCGTCALTCPYSAPKVDEEAKKSVKCHGCADRVAAGMKPVCVEPARLAPLTSARLRRWRSWASAPTSRLCPTYRKPLRTSSSRLLPTRSRWRRRGGQPA